MGQPETMHRLGDYPDTFRVDLALGLVQGRRWHPDDREAADNLIRILGGRINDSKGARMPPAEISPTEARQRVRLAATVLSDADCCPLCETARDLLTGGTELAALRAREVDE
jgi:hypothetical protein